jgi:hypothetical protein
MGGATRSSFRQLISAEGLLRVSYSRFGALLFQVCCVKPAGAGEQSGAYANPCPDILPARRLRETRGCERLVHRHRQPLRLLVRHRLRMYSPLRAVR